MLFRTLFLFTFSSYYVVAQICSTDECCNDCCNGPNAEDCQEQCEAGESFSAGPNTFCCTSEGIEEFDTEPCSVSAPTTTSPTTSNPTTSSPTTSNPTTSPTTSNPTKSPSESPTINPTEAPTQEPSASPTSSPLTSQPTRNPTSSPSSSPTLSPTEFVEESLPLEMIGGVSGGVLLIILGVLFLVQRKKRTSPNLAAVDDRFNQLSNSSPNVIQSSNLASGVNKTPPRIVLKNPKLPPQNYSPASTEPDDGITLDSFLTPGKTTKLQGIDDVEEELTLDDFAVKPGETHAKSAARFASVKNDPHARLGDAQASSGYLESAFRNSMMSIFRPSSIYLKGQKKKKEKQKQNSTLPVVSSRAPTKSNEKGTKITDNDL